MGALVMAFLLLVLALAAILYPFIRRRGSFQAFQTGSHLQELLDRRETLLQGLRELETDRTVGNLGEEDYLRLRDDYERQAAAVMKALDQRANGLAKELDAEILLAKASYAQGVAARPAPCPRCGAALSGGPADATCVRCGYPSDAGKA